MFIIGTFASYYVVFPLTLQFLSDYQVSYNVVNLISLDSYRSTLIVMSLSLGIVFEIPVLSVIFAKAGLLSEEFMRKYRRHVIVVILSMAAIITPTSDIFTLLLVSLPMYILYELSILSVATARRENQKMDLETL